MESTPPRLSIDDPLWDQSTFLGRVKHFWYITDPRTVLVSDDQLEQAKILVDKYRLGQEPTGTTLEEIIYAKKLYSSAFHPDTGEKQNIFGRMSFQVPGGMAITGAMLQWYRTMPAVIFWQWVNQSFNAIVNYTNRNANSPLTNTALGVAYVSATGSALLTAVGFKNFLVKKASPFFLRYVPFAAVAAANCVNIPLMRQSEILQGVDVQDENGNVIGQSKVAAAKGISQVVFSRIVMCAPGMLILPVIMERIEKYNWMKRITYLHGPIQIGLVGCFLIFMVPVACAIYPQRCSINVSTLALLEKDSYSEMKNKWGDKLPQTLYFNKGL